MPVHYAGMASASTSLLRDFGFTLGPAVIGAIALSRAANGSVPPASPPGHASSIAMEALGNGYSVGYAVCGVAAVVCLLLTLVALRGGAGQEATVGIDADGR